jgi:hypothetical protein
LNPRGLSLKDLGVGMVRHRCKLLGSSVAAT